MLRLGWYFCREQALTLSVLAAHFGEYLEDMPIFGVVKETGVDDQGLLEFQRDFFPYPIYRDQSFAFYKALGDRKLAATFLLNPFGFFSGAVRGWGRITKRKIDGNLRGEGIVQGGLIVFDNNGKPVAMHQEETGSEFPLADFVRAVEVVRKQQVSEKGG